MEKFDLGKFLAESGVNIDTDKREQIEYISIDLIAPDPNNFYDLSAIDDLAENIALLGLQQPLRVRPIPEGNTRYIIISGHRRYTALKILIEQDDRDDLREVPCIVERGEDNPKLIQLKLIYANASTRVLSSAEQAKQAEQVEKLLYELKEDGMEFPGRMRDHVAQACKISTGKLARLKVIRDGLADCWRDRWDKSEISESAAYELARIDPEWQKVMFTTFCDKASVYASDVATYAKRFSGIASLKCKKSKQPCDNVCKKQKQSLKLPTYYGAGPCVACCEKCSSLLSCKNACPKLAGKIKELRAARKADAEALEQRAAKAAAPDIAYINGVYSRIGELRKAKNISVERLYSAENRAYSTADDDKEKRLENGTADISRNTPLPFGYCFYASTAHAICGVADLFGCSIDYLLGRTEYNVLPDATQETVEQSVSNVDTWHTGTPDRPGWYICRIKVDGVDKPMYLKYWYGGKTWQGLMEDIQVVTHWVPAVEEDE